jgi:hypothetical protein
MEIQRWMQVTQCNCAKPIAVLAALKLAITHTRRRPQMRCNPFLHPTRYGWLRHPPREGEVKRWAA